MIQSQLIGVALFYFQPYWAIKEVYIYTWFIEHYGLLFNKGILYKWLTQRVEHSGNNCFILKHTPDSQAQARPQLTKINELLVIMWYNLMESAWRAFGIGIAFYVIMALSSSFIIASCWWICIFIQSNGKSFVLRNRIGLSFLFIEGSQPYCMFQQMGKYLRTALFLPALLTVSLSLYLCGQIFLK